MSPYRSFARLIWRSARWQVVAAIALSMLLSLTEGISLVMVFPLIALLGDPSHPASTANAGPRTRLLFHLLTVSHIPRGAWLGTILVVVLISVGMLTQLNGMLTTLTISIVLPLRRNLAAQIYHAVLHADWSFLTRRKSSDITHLISAELGRVSGVTSNVLALISNAMVGVLMLGLACFYAPLLTAAVLVCFGLLLPWQRRSSRNIYRSGIEISLRMRHVYESSAERLQNLKVVKAYGAQDAEQNLFVGRYDQFIKEQIENQWLTIASARRFQMASLVLLCALILIGLNTLHLSAPALLVFLFAFVRATPRVNTVQSKANEIVTDLPAYIHIQEFLADCAEHSEAGEVDAPAPELRRELVLRNVSFGYVAGAPPVLDGIDMAFPAGSITAVAGLSGAGKSTVADLVMGLLLPDSGVIESDGDAITRANARSWRRRIGYVSQDTLLFHDTIRANLLWAKPSATEEQLAEAIEAASAQFVFTLPHRQETIVGDRGVMLSHGQRQRLSLARALLLKPSLLILDEATNSLDLENEENILNVVRGLGVTTILISHRPSTVRIADRVYLLEGGRVTRSGSWDEVRAAVEAEQAQDKSGSPPDDK